MTALIETGPLFSDIEMPPLSPDSDHVMICESPAMLADMSALLNARDFRISPHVEELGDYVVERSFVVR